MAIRCTYVCLRKNRMSEVLKIHILGELQHGKIHFSFRQANMPALLV